MVAHVFADHAHVWIPGHLLIDGFPEGIEEKGFGHGEGCCHKWGQPISAAGGKGAEDEH